MPQQNPLRYANPLRSLTLIGAAYAYLYHPCRDDAEACLADAEQYIATLCFASAMQKATLPSRNTARLCLGFAVSTWIHPAAARPRQTTNDYAMPLLNSTAYCNTAAGIRIESRCLNHATPI